MKFRRATVSSLLVASVAISTSTTTTTTIGVGASSSSPSSGGGGGGYYRDYSQQQQQQYPQFPQQQQQQQQRQQQSHLDRQGESPKGYNPYSTQQQFHGQPPQQQQQQQQQGYHDLTNDSHYSPQTHAQQVRPSDAVTSPSTSYWGNSTPEQTEELKSDAAVNEEASAIEHRQEADINDEEENEDASSLLPDPWQEHVDPASGRFYYYNPSTSVTQWERPVADVVKSSPPVPKDVSTGETLPSGHEMEVDTSGSESLVMLDSSSPRMGDGQESSDGGKDGAAAAAGSESFGSTNTSGSSTGPENEVDEGNYAQDGTMDPFSNAFARRNPEEGSANAGGGDNSKEEALRQDTTTQQHRHAYYHDQQQQQLGSHIPQQQQPGQYRDHGSGQQQQQQQQVEADYQRNKETWDQQQQQQPRFQPQQQSWGGVPNLSQQSSQGGGGEKGSSTFFQSSQQPPPFSLQQTPPPQQRPLAGSQWQQHPQSLQHAPKPQQGQEIQGSSFGPPPAGWFSRQQQQQHRQPPGPSQINQQQLPPKQQQQQQPPLQHQQPRQPPQQQRGLEYPPNYPMRPASGILPPLSKGFGLSPPGRQQGNPNGGQHQHYPPPQQYQQYQTQQKQQQQQQPQFQQQQYQQQYPGYNPFGGPSPPPGSTRSGDGGGIGSISAGPGAGQLVQHRTEELSHAVKEKWSQALGGLSVFGSRTKELAETAKNQIGESAQSAQKVIGETSTGIWGRFRSGIDQVKGSIFERDNTNPQGQGGYPLSQFGVPPPFQRGDQYPLSGGYPPNYQQPPPGAQRGGPPPVHPPQTQGGHPLLQPPSGQRDPRGHSSGYVPRPGYTPPYPHVSGGPTTQQGGAPPVQSQWGNRGGPPGLLPQQRGQQPNMPAGQQKQQEPMPPRQDQRSGRHGQQFHPNNYADQYTPGQRLPQHLSTDDQQRQQQHMETQHPANHPGWNQ